MPTKREYLVEKGLAKQGHGRFSNAAKEAIKAAINKGIKFDEGLPPSSDVPETAEPRFDRPKGMYEFVNPDGTTFSRLHTNACSKCPYSFQWCMCVSGPFQWAYLGGQDIHATLRSVPGRATVQPEPRRRGRPRKKT